MDPVLFHRAFERHLTALDTPEGIAGLRDEAVRLWNSTDPAVHSYIEMLTTATPDEWDSGFEGRNLIDWYRISMAPYLIPTRAFHAPEVLRRRLPDLGWKPAEARRLARGRELQLLLDNHVPRRLADPLLVHFTVSDKGWLDGDDLQAALIRFRSLDRGVFRSNQDLIPLVENAYEVIEAALAKPDHVLLSVST